MNLMCQNSLTKSYPKNFFFDYPSNAKIRIKRVNCLVCADYPLLYGVVTEKLTFTIPKVMTILTKTHLFIPHWYYMNVLNNFYHGKNNS